MTIPNDFQPTPPRRFRFLLGNRCVTPAALEAIEAAGCSVLRIFGRHESGEWGEVTDVNSLLNEEAIRDGNQILSIYTLRNGGKVWVVTEADRSMTTIMLPEEYPPPLPF